MSREAYWSRVAKRGSLECWPWLGSIDRDGYGKFEGRSATRYGYALASGQPVPADMTVDHLCFMRSCQNPRHLTLATARANAARRQNVLRPTCFNGHPWSAANTYRSPAGRRVCRECHRHVQRRRRAERRTAA